MPRFQTAHMNGSGGRSDTSIHECIRAEFDRLPFTERRHESSTDGGFWSKRLAYRHGDKHGQITWFCDEPPLADRLEVPK